MAKIIQLDTFRTSVRSKHGNISFPQLYRAQGFYWNEPINDHAHPTPSDRPAPHFYTLSERDDGGYANVAYTPIRSLDPAIDSGWLLIRHHRKLEEAEGYLSALADFNTGWKGRAPKALFQTKDGLFTLVERKPSPGTPDHLAIYVMLIPDPHINTEMGRMFSTGTIDYHQIVHPDGSVTIDPDMLLDPASEEDIFN